MRINFLISRLGPLVAFVVVMPVLAQVNTGEVRLRVTDPAGTGIAASVTVSGESNQYFERFTTNDSGELDVKRLAFGFYSVRADKGGFAGASATLEVRSAIPVEHSIRLTIAPVTSSVSVTSAPLIDPYGTSSITQIGSQQIQERAGLLPGRSIQDLVDSEPGWLEEGNAVLHPRGSEYQTQFVIDGIPLTDNRSPGFGPEIESDDLDSVSIYVAGFPADYGRKLGGVVELNTHREPGPGLHGLAVLSGGSYDTGTSYARLQFAGRDNTFGISGSGAMSAHYLNPVVPENYTNRGTTADVAVNEDSDLTAHDRLSLGVRHELSRYEIPNERLQQVAGQLQVGDNFETIGSVRYQHIFSTDGVGTVAGMVRNNAKDLNSNQKSTPIEAFQHNGFREGYFKAALSLHRGSQEFTGGVDSDATSLHEYFNYRITDPSQFDPNTAPELTFTAGRPDLEQSAFLEDLVRIGEWTFRAGLRWDHYQLLLNRNDVSPRLSAGRYLSSTRTVLHASFDRVFQTPSSENILISSSPQIGSIGSQFLRLPVQPSRGSYYEGGFVQAIEDRASFAVNFFRRDMTNFADDNQLLNTGVSYPISFSKSAVCGADAKISLVHVGRLTGFANYSYMVANVWNPVTGGLFIGTDLNAALTQLSGHFPASQDQRNTARARLRYQISPRLWLSSGFNYGSGLPFAFTGTEADALSQYGSEVVSRINFVRGRVKPSLAVSGSIGWDLYKHDRFTSRFIASGDNLNNRLNVIDFGGLFSGNAIAPGRSVALRLDTRF